MLSKWFYWEHVGNVSVLLEFQGVKGSKHCNTIHISFKNRGWLLKESLKNYDKVICCCCCLFFDVWWDPFRTCRRHLLCTFQFQFPFIFTIYIIQINSIKKPLVGKTKRSKARNEWSPKVTKFLWLLILKKLQHNDYKQRTSHGECTTGPDRTCASLHLSVHSDDGYQLAREKEKY